MNVIEAYRVKYHLSQEDLAKLVGVTRAYIAHIENGIRKPSPNVALEIERATNGEIKAEWLIFPERYKNEIEEYLNKSCCEAAT